MTGVVQPEGAITSVPTGAITDQMLSPDGQTLYVARDGTINAYSVSTGTLINSWSIGTELGGIDISPDGSFLVATELQGGSGATFPVYRLDLSTGV